MNLRPGERNVHGTEKLKPDYLRNCVAHLEEIISPFGIIYVFDPMDEGQPIPRKFLEKSEHSQWFRERLLLPDDNPKKFWMRSGQSSNCRADDIAIELFNLDDAIVISRDKFKKPEDLKLFRRPHGELCRFAFEKRVFGSVSCVGKTKSTNSEVLQNFYQRHLTPNELLQIRRKALSGIQDLIVDSAAMERRLNEPLSRVQPDPLTHTPMESLGDQIKKKKGNSWIGKSKENSRELPTDATLPPDETLESIPNVPPVQIEYSSVPLYNTRAMLIAHNTDVLLIGAPAIDHRTSLWTLKWPMHSIVVDLPPEVSAEIDNLSETPALLGIKGHLKHLSGDVYELSHFAGLVNGLHPELFPEKSETSVIFSKWGYSLAHQLHQWRKRNTKVIEFSDSAPAESSHPDSVNSKTEDSQSVIKPEPSPVVHPPKSPAQPIPAEPKFQPPTPPPTNPQPRVIKPLSPVDKTSHEKPSSTAGQSPPTDSIQEPERSHTGSEKNSKWAIVWVMAAVASLLAVISQIL
jgi:hypothetical protein